MLYTGTGLCVIPVNVLVNSTIFHIFCDTLYVASVAENLREPLWLSWLVTFRIHCMFHCMFHGHVRLFQVYVFNVLTLIYIYLSEHIYTMN